MNRKLLAPEGVPDFFTPIRYIFPALKSRKAWGRLVRLPVQAVDEKVGYAHLRKEKETMKVISSSLDTIVEEEALLVT